VSTPPRYADGIDHNGRPISELGQLNVERLEIRLDTEQLVFA
jgi:hypothetical protein